MENENYIYLQYLGKTKKLKLVKTNGKPLDHLKEIYEWEKPLDWIPVLKEDGIKLLQENPKMFKRIRGQAKPKKIVEEKVEDEIEKINEEALDKEDEEFMDDVKKIDTNTIKQAALADEKKKIADMTEKQLKEYIEQKTGEKWSINNKTKQVSVAKAMEVAENEFK